MINTCKCWGLEVNGGAIERWIANKREPRRILENISLGDKICQEISVFTLEVGICGCLYLNLERLAVSRERNAGIGECQRLN